MKGEENYTIFYAYHLYQLIVDAEGYFPPGHLHGHTFGMTSLNEGSARRRDL